MRVGMCVVIALAVLGVVRPPATRADTVVIPYGSCGWKYLPGAIGSTPALSSLSLDDSSWPTGCAPFVAPWGCASPGTSIPTNGRVVLRRHILNTGPPAIATYTVKWRSNVATGYNGHEGNAAYGPADCGLGPMSGVFPLQTGDNVFLVDFFTGVTGEAGGYIDVQLVLDGVTEAKRQTWGQVKAHYR